VKQFIQMRRIFAAALVLALAVALSGVAIAQYDDDDDRYYQRSDGDQAREYGYRAGYRDGYGKGRHEGRENDPGDINVRDLREATRGYQPWMGPVEWFRDGYRAGYHNGFRSGYQSVNSGWGNRNDEYRRYYPY
jgi:hypothetical protein